ncbi:MAG: aminopeptidase, partial [Actinobacteria bacterium]|nr:aminopeptidase [Actinomycetota bacterium]
MAAELDPRLEKYAELAVRVGANVEPGQIVFVSTELAHAPLARALTRAAYAAGARYVDVSYRDQHVRRAMIEFGPDEALTHTPEWVQEKARAFSGNAFIATTGDPEPDLLSDLDGARVG